MEEVFIVVPRSVTLDDVADVLRRTWTLDEDVGVPYVQTGPDSTAYVAEPEVTRTFEEELALDHPDLWDRVRGTVGDHRILSLRYRDPGTRTTDCTCHRHIGAGLQADAAQCRRRISHA
jgi:hypothetical protein